MEPWHRKQLADVWPHYGLVVSTSRLRLQLPSDADLLGLARLSADVHGADGHAIVAPWTAVTGCRREQAVLQHHWGQRAAWSPEHWDLDFAVVVDDELVGIQALRSRDFGITRSVSTSSWLHPTHRGRGVGREMRNAVLRLAFDGLGAERATSEALAGNLASIAVTERLGYRFNGDDVRVHRTRRRIVHRYVMDRAAWASMPRPAVEITGLEPCLAVLGAPASPHAELTAVTAPGRPGVPAAHAPGDLSAPLEGRERGCDVA